MLSNSQQIPQIQVLTQVHVQPQPSISLISSPIFTNSVTSSDISTIFIIGFPDDFKERELLNMFLFAPGFEGAVLKATNISSISPGLVGFDEANRKQLIGFVKFSKSSEAAFALEILNGKILDQERGLVLKAEMAKKNLHIKSQSPASLAGSVLSTPKTIVIPKSFYSNSNNNNNNFSYQSTFISSLSDDESILPGQCTCPASIGPCVCNTGSSSLSSSSIRPTISSPNNRMMSITLPGQSDPSIICAPVKREESVSPSVSGTNPSAAVAIEVPTIVKPAASLLYFSSNSTTPSPPILMSKQYPMIPVVSDRVLDISSLQRNLITSPNLGSMAAIFGENFPCNTLYVGNLPPSAQEEELRALFRNCLGYRRLSFRPKSSGPMCFVEFEDIACATAAMETLYGTMISCSTSSKGGIRLSFSKNPLGLRVASPSPASQSVTAHSSSNSFMEAIGAETDNPDHRQAISTIFAHYYRLNPHKGPDTSRLI